MVKDLPQFEETQAIEPRMLRTSTSAGALSSTLANFAFQAARKVRKIGAQQQKDEQAADKTAAQIQIRDGINHIREKVLDPSVFSDIATQNYDAQVSGLTKGILNSADPKIRPALADFASYYGDSNRNVVVDRVQRLKKNQLTGSLQEYLSKTTDDAVNAKVNNEIIPDPDDKESVVSKGDILIGQANKTISNAVDRGLITPKEAFAYKQGMEKSYTEAGYLHQFEQAINQGHEPGKWLNSLSKNKNVDDTTKQQVQLKAIGKVNEINQAVTTNKNLIKQQADDTITQVQNGNLDINSPHVANVKLRTGALPEEDRQDIEHRMNAASVFSTAKKELKWMPFNQRADLFNKLAPDPSDPEFKTKNDIHQSILKESDRQQREFKSDPFAYVQDNPDVIRAFDARETAANDGAQKMQPADGQTIDPFAVTLDKEKMLGANNQQLSIMDKPTAARIVSSIEALPDAKSKVQLLNDVYDTYGKYNTIAGRDLQKAGMSANILYLANLDKIPESKGQLDKIFSYIDQQADIKNRLAQRSQSGESFKNFQQSVSTSREMTSLFATLPNTSTSEKQKSDMVNLVSIAAAGDFLAGNSSDADSAAKKMANVIFQAPYSAILKEARIPRNISPNDAKDAMYATEKEISKMNFLPLKREPESDETRIMRILHNNADKNFVQRVLKPEGKPILDLGKNQFATHKMSWATTDGKPIVYPKVIQDLKTGKLKELSAKDALDHAIKTKQLIVAKDNDEAEWFSSNYKKVWNIEGKKITLKKGIPVDLTKAEIMQEDMDLIQAGHWRTLGDDSGVYWIDSNGFTPQVLEKGEAQRLEVHWKDLKDNTSELNQLIKKHPRKLLKRIEGLF